MEPNLEKVRQLAKDLSKTEKPKEWTLNPDNVKAVIDGMYGVVNEGGTGTRAKLPNVEVCGKTGTAQLASMVWTLVADWVVTCARAPADNVTSSASRSP